MVVVGREKMVVTGPVCLDRLHLDPLWHRLVTIHLTNGQISPLIRTPSEHEVRNISQLNLFKNSF